MKHLPMRIFLLLVTTAAGLFLFFFTVWTPLVWIAIPLLAAFATMPLHWMHRPVEETGVRQRFSCPIDRHDVTATFAVDPAGRTLRVKECSAFFFPEQVSCVEECVRLRNRVRLQHAQS